MSQTLPTCGNCPLFVRAEAGSPMGECHAEPQAVAVPKQAQPSVISPNQPAKTELVFLGGWALMNEGSIGCRHHPALAVGLEEVRAGIRSQARPGRTRR